MMCKGPQQNRIHFSKVIPDLYRHRRVKYPQGKNLHRAIYRLRKPYISQAPRGALG